MELQAKRQTRDEYQLSPSARGILAVVEGAGQPLEPSVIAECLLITTGSMTSLLDTLPKRGLIRRLPHPGDRRKLLVDIAPDAQAIVDELLPSFHAREHELISAALTTSEQRRPAPPRRQDPAGRHPGGPSTRRPATRIVSVAGKRYIARGTRGEQQMSYGIIHQFKGATREQYEASAAAVHPSDGTLPGPGELLPLRRPCARTAGSSSPSTTRRRAGKASVTRS